MEKKKKLSMSIALFVILALVGSTIAYLLSRDSKNTEIKVTNANVSIDEEFSKSSLKAGYNVYKKNVPIKNEGENPCFVRVFMDFSDSSVIDSTNVKTYFSGAESQPAKPDNEDTLDSNWKIASGKEWLGENWVYVDESGNVSDSSQNVSSGLGGYYYYKLPVAPDDSTKPLVSWVMTYFKEASDIKVYDILVYAETVQTIGIDGTDYAADTKNINWVDAWKSYLHTD